MVGMPASTSITGGGVAHARGGVLGRIDRRHQPGHGDQHCDPGDHDHAPEQGSRPYWPWRPSRSRKSVGSRRCRKEVGGLTKVKKRMAGQKRATIEGGQHRDGGTGEQQPADGALDRVAGAGPGDALAGVKQGKMPSPAAAATTSISVRNWNCASFARRRSGLDLSGNPETRGDGLDARNGVEPMSSSAAMSAGSWEMMKARETPDRHAQAQNENGRQEDPERDKRRDIVGANAALCRWRQPAPCCARSPACSPAPSEPEGRRQSALGSSGVSLPGGTRAAGKGRARSVT